MCQEREDPRLMPVDCAFGCVGHGKSPPDGPWLVHDADWLENAPGFKWFACFSRSCGMARVQIKTDGADLTDAQLTDIPEVD